MPSEGFLKPEKKAQPEQFQIKSIETYPPTSREKIVGMLRGGDPIRLTVTNEGRIILSHPSGTHELLDELEIKENKCAVVNSEVRMDLKGKILKVGYHLEDKNKNPDAKKIIEAKLLEFARSVGVEIDRVEGN